MENPVKMDDLGVPLFSETSISETTPAPGWFQNQGAISLGKEDVVQQGPSRHGAMSSRLTFGMFDPPGGMGGTRRVDPSPPRLSTVVSTVFVVFFF